MDAPERLETRIGWIAAGDESLGSSRIGVFNIHRKLTELGHSSIILHYNQPSYGSALYGDYKQVIKKIINAGVTHLVIHKIHCQQTAEIVKFCKSQNIRTIYVIGDWYESQLFQQLLKLVDKVIVSSPKMISTLSGIPTYRVEDAIETGTLGIKTHTNKDSLILGWFGYQDKLAYAQHFIESLGTKHSFYSITDSPKASYNMGQKTTGRWDPRLLGETLLREVDAVVIPVNLADGIIADAKSANRLTTALSLGLPTLFTPLSSYMEIYKKGREGCYPCYSREDWLTNLERLTDAEIRNKTKDDYTLETRNKYSLAAVAQRYLEIFLK